jgi:hypothetical protein
MERMTLDQLIGILQELRVQHGNLPVLWGGEYGGDAFGPEDIRVLDCIHSGYLDEPEDIKHVAIMAG